MRYDEFKKLNDSELGKRKRLTKKTVILIIGVIVVIVLGIVLINLTLIRSTDVTVTKAHNKGNAFVAAVEVVKANSGNSLSIKFPPMYDAVVERLDDSTFTVKATADIEYTAGVITTVTWSVKIHFTSDGKYTYDDLNIPAQKLPNAAALPS